MRVLCVGGWVGGWRGCGCYACVCRMWVGGEDVEVMHVCAVCGWVGWWVDRMWRLCMCVLCELAVRWIGIVVGVIWGLCVCCVLVGGCLYVKVCDLQLIGNLKKS